MSDAIQSEAAETPATTIGAAPSSPTAPVTAPAATGNPPWYLALGQWYTAPRTPQG